MLAMMSAIIIALEFELPGFNRGEVDQLLAAFWPIRAGVSPIHTFAPKKMGDPELQSEPPKIFFASRPAFEGIMHSSQVGVNGIRRAFGTTRKALDLHR